ncbi:MAG: hypothetical protein LUD48_05550, partial [Prevotella sp.]|nr:hypothetical protein [Prevotella sp.]
NTANTRVSGSAPISIVEGSPEIVTEDGVTVLRLGVKKNNSNSTSSSNSITIVSLKAVIDSTYLTDEEKEAGDEVAVYSDWARLYESTESPHIHQASKVDKNGAPEGCSVSNWIVTRGASENGVDFWSCKTIYADDAVVNGAVNQEATISWNNDYIVAYPVYTDDYDLNNLVMIVGVDAEGNKAIYTSDQLAAYGLEIKFELMDHYMLQDETQTVITDQQQFAVLDTETGILTSQSIDKVAKNSGAIGKQPVIKVKLIDTNNNNATVDVAYFKIQWAKESAENKTYEGNGEFKLSGDFVCSSDDADVVVTATFPSMTLEYLYSYCDMSMTVFHATYTLPTTESADNAQGVRLYASAADAENDNNPLEYLGWAYDVENENDGQTHNLELIITAKDMSDLQGTLDYKNSNNSTEKALYNQYADYRITSTDLYNGYKTVTAWTYYENKANGSKLIFPVTLTINLPTIINKYEAIESRFSSETFNISNILYSSKEDAFDGAYSAYTTTPIVGDLNSGYLVTDADGNTSVATEPADFVTDGNDVKWEFVSGYPSSSYTASTDGTELIYNYTENGTKKTVVVATIDTETGYIQLSEENLSYSRALVGQDVKVKLTATYCALGDIDVIEAYPVHVIEPLSIEITQDDSEGFVIYDLDDNNSVQLENCITITENNGTKGVVWTNVMNYDLDEDGNIQYDSEGNIMYLDPDNDTNDDLVTWYDVDASSLYDYETLKYIATATSGSQTYTLAEWEEMGAFKFDLTEDGVFSFTNLGMPLNSTLTVTIPIYIETKWQSFSDLASITITIKKAPNASGVRRK